MACSHRSCRHRRLAAPWVFFSQFNNLFESRRCWLQSKFIFVFRCILQLQLFHFFFLDSPLSSSVWDYLIPIQWSSWVFCSLFSHRASEVKFEKGDLDKSLKKIKEQHHTIRTICSNLCSLSNHLKRFTCGTYAWHSSWCRFCINATSRSDEAYVSESIVFDIRPMRPNIH